MKDTTETIINVLQEILDYARLGKKLSDLPDCNTCGKRLRCEYLPDWGHTTRPNCPLWVTGGE